MSQLRLFKSLGLLFSFAVAVLPRNAVCDRGRDALELLKQDPDLVKKYKQAHHELELLFKPEKRPQTPTKDDTRDTDCDCDELESALKSHFQSHSSPRPTQHVAGTGLSQSCKDCHEGNDSAFKFQPWMDSQQEWEKRLASTDPSEKEAVRTLIYRLYNGLVDTKNMPPQSEPDKRNDFYQHKGSKEFIDFLKTQFATLNSENANDPLAVAPNKVSLMDPDLEKQYKALLPSVESPRLSKIFNDPNLILIDKKHLAPGYQDPSIPVQGVRSTEPGFRGAGFAKDSPFIDEKGHLKLWSFGFGVEDTPNAESFHFLQLPKDQSGNLKKIKVSERVAPPPDEGTVFDWEFPLGTVSGEVILGTDSAGRKHVLQIRLRTKDQAEGPWAADVFKPFPTVNHLRTKLAKIAATNGDLALEATKVLGELKKPQRLRSLSLGMHGYQVGDLDSKGATETLPEMSEPLSLELLKETFKSSLGAEWDREARVTAFAPTSDQPFSIVSQNNNEGALQVGRNNCAKCHKDANKPIRENYLKSHPRYYSSILAYANKPGSDQNLRFHIFDPAQFKKFGSTGVVDNRKLNSVLLPILDIKKTTFK